MSALKYTSFMIVIFFVLFMLGLFLQPQTASPTDPEWYKSLFTSDSTLAGGATQHCPLARRG